MEFLSTSGIQELNKRYASDILISSAGLEGLTGAVSADKLASASIKWIVTAVDLYKLT